MSKVEVIELEVGGKAAFFLRTVDAYFDMKYELTGEVARVRWDELRSCVGFLHCHRDNRDGKKDELVRIPVPCHVIGFASPPSQNVETRGGRTADICTCSLS